MSAEDKLMTWNDFARVKMQVGTIIEAEEFKEAIRPAYKLKLDFGPDGIKKTSAQITKLYKPDQLIGRQVIAVTNFPPKQIAKRPAILVLPLASRYRNGRCNPFPCARTNGGSP